MLCVYLNYPNSMVTVHKNLDCGNIEQMEKEGQRYVRIDLSSLSGDLERFANKEHRFASSSATNDMWLEIDLKNEQFELSVVDFIHSLLALQYKPFQDAMCVIHCEQ